MKTFRGTGLFALFVVALALISYFLIYQGEQRKNDAKDKASILIPFKEDAVTDVLVESGSSRLELKRVDGLWHITQPVNALADQQEAKNYVTSIIQERSLDQIRDDESVPWGVFGLEKPSGSVAVTEQGGQVKKVLLGTRKTYNNDLYLRFDKENKVLLVSSMWTSLLGKDPKSLRDKQIFKGDPDKINEIHIKLSKEGARPVVLHKTDGVWRFKGDSETKIDGGEVKKFLDNLKQTKAFDFAAEQSGDEDLKKYDLSGGQAALIELVGDTGTWKLRISKTDKQGYAYLVASDMSPVIKVMKSSAEPLQLEGNEFRDKAAPFAFKSHDVRKLTYRSPLTSLDLVKDGGVWKFKDPKEGEEVAKDQVENLIKELSNLRVKKYLGPVKAKGLNPPKFLVALRDQEDKLLISVKWGDEFKDDKIPQMMAYATTSLIHETVGVDAAKMKELPGQTMVKSKDAKPQSTQAAPRAEH